MGGVPVPRHCAGRAMQRAGTKSRNQRYERHLVIHRVRMPFGIPRRPAPTIGVVRISTKTLHTQLPS